MVDAAGVHSGHVDDDLRCEASPTTMSMTAARSDGDTAVPPWLFEQQVVMLPPPALFDEGKRGIWIGHESRILLTVDPVELLVVGDADRDGERKRMPAPNLRQYPERSGTASRRRYFVP